LLGAGVVGSSSLLHCLPHCLAPPLQVVLSDGCDNASNPDSVHEVMARMGQPAVHGLRVSIITIGGGDGRGDGSDAAATFAGWAATVAYPPLPPPPPFLSPHTPPPLSTLASPPLQGECVRVVIDPLVCPPPPALPHPAQPPRGPGALD
jgi:hypothetical protein